MYVSTPRRTGHLRMVLVGVGQHGFRSQSQDVLDALRPATVHVDRQRRGTVEPADVSQLARWRHLVHSSGQHRQFPQATRSGEHDLRVRKMGTQSAQCGNSGEQVAEPERSQNTHDLRRRMIGQGHEDSVDEHTTSSRISQPGGCDNAKTTVSATSSGLFSLASAGGLYCSVRPSKKGVYIPPGISSVTPTPPANSAASARVNPTTPNFD